LDEGQSKGELWGGVLVLLALFAPVEVGFARVGNFFRRGTLVALRLHPAIELG